jgi:hypothetical protein
MTTARRLFKRENTAETVRAITAHAVVPPSRLLEDYPPALEAVCMRALGDSPDERYPTMVEMRRDLLAVIRESGAKEEPSEGLARLMQTVFEDRVAEKKETLRRVRAGSNLTHVPVAEIDEGIELGQVPLELATHAELASQTSASVTATNGAARLASRRSTSTRLVAFGVGVAFVGFLFFLARTRAVTSVASPSATAAAPSAAASAAPPIAPAPEEILVRVETDPADVVVSLNGERVGSTPLDLRLPRADRPVALELRHPGYVSRAETLVPDRDQTLRVELSASPPAATTTPRSAPRTAASAANPWVKWH